MKKKLKKMFRRWLWRKFMQHFKDKIIHVSSTVTLDDMMKSKEGLEYLREIKKRELADELAEYMLKEGLFEVVETYEPILLARKYTAHAYLLKK